MRSTQHAGTLNFLSGGGEMGELTRSKDWSINVLGPPETWPDDLRTTLGIILHSRFPMFLFYGPELICFYNDAYRLSLGNDGKHPSILGMRGEEAWPEIWTIIKPLIDQVLSGGEATWAEDQLIPIYRNGHIEDVYWTFSYSPVIDGEGKINSVLVTCAETTDKVVTEQKRESFEKKLEETERRLRLVITNAPVAIAIFKGEDYSMEIVNNSALRIMGKSLEEVVDQPLMKVLPELMVQGIKQLLDAVRNTGASFSSNEFPIEFNRNGVPELTYINFSFNPLYDEDGKIDSIMAVGIDITEHIKAHKKLEANEEKLNIVIEASELATWELNVQTREVDYSDRYIEIFGYPPGTAMSHIELVDHLHPDDVSTREKAFSEAFVTGVLGYQTRIIRKDNTIRWIEGKGKVFYDEAGKPFKMIGTARDITEEKKYQAELEEREKRFRLLADSMPQHIWTADAEGNVNYFNKWLLDYTGFREEEIDGTSWVKFIHPDDVEKNVARWMESVKTGNPYLFEHRFRKHDGEYRWQLSRATAQKDENGKISMWVGTSADIHDQKTFRERLEKEVKQRTRELADLNATLKKSEERYHLMVEEVQDYAILYINKEGTVENWNSGAQKIKGYRPDEIIGKNFSNFYTEEDRKAGLPQYLLRQAELTGRAGQEGWRVRKDGTHFWASVVITAVHNDAGEVIGYSKVTHDLTEKKAADDKLKATAMELELKNEDLVKMNKELQSFAYISSHDLQEPLRKIQTFATRIIEKELNHLSENGKDYFQRMQNAAFRMQNLIDDLLAYSRTNTAERIYIKTDLGAIIEEMRMDMREELQQKNAVIDVIGNSEVNIIPFQFRQLLYNLTSNALKFSDPDHGCHITIETEIGIGSKFGIQKLFPDVEYCHIRFEDNGIGFEPEFNERIFGLFQRLHGKSQYTGTGIGLSIVKKIVDNHNGAITAHGEVNKGARFDIYIPRANTE